MAQHSMGSYSVLNNLKSIVIYIMRIISLTRDAGISLLKIFSPVLTLVITVIINIWSA